MLYHASIIIIKFLPPDSEFKGVSHRISQKIKNALYLLQISASVLEIFKIEKCVKYANERTDMSYTQPDIVCKNQQVETIYIQQRALKLMVALKFYRQRTWLKNYVPMAIHSFPVPSNLISIIQ